MLSQFQDDMAGLPPLKFERIQDDEEAKRRSHLIWNRIIWLLSKGKVQDAEALVEEFDEPAIWTVDHN